MTFTAERIHVTNLGKTAHGNHLSSYLANTFRTGGDATDRYSLTSVVLNFHSGGNNSNVAIYTVNGSDPGTQIGANLTQVGTAANGAITFNAPLERDQR